MTRWAEWCRDSRETRRSLGGIGEEERRLVFDRVVEIDHADLEARGRSIQRVALEGFELGEAGFEQGKDRST